MMSFSIKPTFVRRENMAIWFSFLNSTQSNWSWKYFDWRCWSNESVQILSQSFSILSQNVDWLIYTPSLKSTIDLNSSTVVAFLNSEIIFSVVKMKILKKMHALFSKLKVLLWRTRVLWSLNPNIASCPSDPQMTENLGLGLSDSQIMKNLSWGPSGPSDSQTKKNLLWGLSNPLGPSGS